MLDIAKNYKTIYGMGTWGWLVTKQAIERKTKESSWWTTTRANNISKVIDKGYFMFDCIGLIKGILWGWNGSNKIYGGAGYNINGVPDVNTEGMLAKCNSVTTDFSKLEIGSYLWMSGHCGIYIGDGLCVECTPAWTNNVQITAVENIGKKSGYNSRKWTKHGKMPYITYEKEKLKEYEVIANTIPIYSNSLNAKNQTNSNGRWEKGIYYIFNEANGMINITKKQNTAGAWINPIENKIETSSQEEIKDKLPVVDQEITGNKPVIEEELENKPVDEEAIKEENSDNSDENKEIKKENIFVRIFRSIINFIKGIFK